MGIDYVTAHRQRRAARQAAAGAVLALWMAPVPYLAASARAQDPASNVVVTRNNALYTVEAHGAPVNDVLKRLSKEAGFGVESPVAMDGGEPVDIRLADVHLDRVLEKLLAKANHLIVYAQGTDRVETIILLSPPAAAPAGGKPGMQPGMQPGIQPNGPAGPGGVRPPNQPGVNPNARPMTPTGPAGVQPPVVSPQTPSQQTNAALANPRLAAAARAAAESRDPAAIAAMQRAIAAAGGAPPGVDPSQMPANGAPTEKPYVDPGAWQFGMQHGDQAPSEE